MISFFTDARVVVVHVIEPLPFFTDRARGIQKSGELPVGHWRPIDGKGLELEPMSGSLVNRTFISAHDKRSCGNRYHNGLGTVLGPSAARQPHYFQNDNDKGPEAVHKRSP